jgi:mediator of RNA polymerase II transcription subunit 7
MMEDQLERSRAETRGIMEGKEKVEKILEGLSKAPISGRDDLMQGPAEETIIKDGSDIWEELDKEFG